MNQKPDHVYTFPMMNMDVKLYTSMVTEIATMDNPIMGLGDFLVYAVHNYYNASGHVLAVHIQNAGTIDAMLNHMETEPNDRDAMIFNWASDQCGHWIASMFDNIPELQDYNNQFLVFAADACLYLGVWSKQKCPTLPLPGSIPLDF